MATEHLAIDFQKFPQDQLIELSYVSQATHEMGMLGLMNLLEDAVHKNTRAKVTGILFYDSGIFGQILEGYPRQLSFIWDSITADHRHNNIEVLAVAPLQERRFSSWAMKFYGSDEISKYVPELRVHFKEGDLSLPDEILTLMRSIGNQAGENSLAS
jgi:hypothetical protein